MTEIKKHYSALYNSIDPIKTKTKITEESDHIFYLKNYLKSAFIISIIMKLNNFVVNSTPTYMHQIKLDRVHLSASQE